ncbi:helix-turn-helix transcriptional regulator [Georgenia thermotolerans]|uniref:WYL domain-containing protein n=1 Tax=Georgenia thermotolerans TaxID=527326 RepID=A0A7J5UUT6_9MICO|nr:WYL domain-containing protein [Georgenia thermotolerans]KAE8766033.1 WYL domain-containing protein [Georgenia thermotolerans]
MNRIDRLYAMREELRRAGRAGRTAEQLAAVFEVSLRTVKRDISALQQAGFPVWARLGRTGGYIVDEAATLPPVAFTPAEVAALAAALEAHRGQPFDGHGRAALTKILNVMAPSVREETARLAGRIWTNDNAAPHGARRMRTAVESALLERRVLALRYRDGEGAVTSRRVDPQLLAHTGDRWYLVARCRLRRGVRWFRLDRIEHASVTAEPAVDIPMEDIGEPPETARPAHVSR